MKKRRSDTRAHKVLRVLAGVVLICVLAFAGLVGFLSATEYRPGDVEPVEVVSTTPAAASVAQDQTLRYLTWNVGFGALGDNADFFMDGGTAVMPSDEARVDENVAAMAEHIAESNADYIFLQEVDRNSKRSFGKDQVPELAASMANYSFAYNFRVAYVPYPLPPIGRVESGILSASRYDLGESMRYQLPLSFGWPESMANLKRCLLVSRTPVVDAAGNATGKELVSVNLHLEAYDSGAGKIAQTKMLANLLAQEAEKGNYVVAGGDFNQVFSGTDTSAYPSYEGTWAAGALDEHAFGDGFSFLMDTTTPSCRSLDKPYAGADHEHFQYYMLDGFIVSSNVAVSKVETQDLGFAHSDHNPVMMELRLAA
ncbi:MAG: endonuclease/exonuclease/phosphatase family protein [Atopobiaceae bacterium]|jgi:endonuclease/exonuclease/phosphatase family metal-dependent hydrolase